MSRQTREGTYAKIGRQYLPAAAMMTILSVGIAEAHRALAPKLHGFLGDLAEGAVLSVVAVAAIGATIVRPFEHAMHARRRASAEREAAFRAETERREFERRLASGMELCDNESDLLSTTSYAVDLVAGDSPVELLLASERDAPFERALVAGREAPGCAVTDPVTCPATRRGAVQVFGDSDAIDACPWLRDRPIGHVGCVCAPVSITGRALGVLHTVHEVGHPLSTTQVEQLTSLADHVGAHIGVLRLRAAAEPEAARSTLVSGTAVGGAPTDGAAQERLAVLGAETAG